MSMDFTTHLVGPPGELAPLLHKTCKRLSDLGMRRSSQFYRAAFDAARGVYDEVEADDEVDTYQSLDDLQNQLAGWEGASVTFQAEGFSVYVLVCVGPEAAWSWVDIAEKSLRKLGAADREHEFYAALGAVAAGCGARAGYGNMEMPFEAVSEANAGDAVFACPAFENDPSSIGLIARDLMDRETLETKAAGAFRIRPWTVGYWLLEEKSWYLNGFLNKAEV